MIRQFLAAATLFPVLALAQAPANSNLNVNSTEVLSDHRVVFRIYAPSAKAVSVNGEIDALIRGPLQKDDMGIWSVTLGPLAPDYYTYSFTVDGVRIADPRNGMFRPGLQSVSNMFLVPGPESAFQEMQVVPHGELRAVWYDSKTLGVQRRMHVYTPPGYDRSGRKYPVLYLLHGNGEDDYSWAVGGRTNVILDNLIASGKARPMIVVMPSGNIPAPDVGTGSPAGAAADMAARLEASRKWRDTFIDDLMTGVIPHVESNYRVLTDRNSRAIAGFSLGGARTIHIAMKHVDKFAYAGVFSMGIVVGSTAGARAIENTALGSVADFSQEYAAFLADPDKTNRMMTLYWIGSGKGDTPVGDSPRLLDQTLTARGIRHEYHETEGGHNYGNWRPYLRDFAQLLFR
jgi:enterochelin esterase family protein